MQKQLKAEFWTKISEISFQVMRRNWICKCACNSCFCSHRYLKVQFKIQVSADDHIDILKAKAAVRNLEFRWGETAKSRMAGRYTHRRPLSVGQGIWNLKPEFYHGFPLCAGQGIWNLKPEFYPGFPLSAGQGIWNLQPHFPLFQVPTWNVNQKADWPKSAQTASAFCEARSLKSVSNVRFLWGKESEISNLNSIPDFCFLRGKESEISNPIFCRFKFQLGM